MFCLPVPGVGSISSLHFVPVILCKGSGGFGTVVVFQVANARGFDFAQDRLWSTRQFKLGE